MVDQWEAPPGRSSGAGRRHQARGRLAIHRDVNPRLRGSEFQGDGLSFITPSEQETKNVKFDGKEYPNEGPNTDRGASSSIRRVDGRTLVITDKAGGKVRDTEEIDLSADLKTLTITVHIAGRDKPNVMVFERK